MNHTTAKKPIPFQELSLLSRFLFDAVMEDDETCQAMFEIILGRELGTFTHTNAEKEFRKSPLFRSVCLDVFSKDEAEEVFNAEMQGTNTGNLPKRSRYYQAHLDASLLEPGEIDFNKLNDSYIVMIAPFDLFGQGKYCYTFRMRADEDTSLILSDGMTRIFLNTRGTNEDEVSAELVEFLHYVEASGSSKPPDSDSPRIQKIYERIRRVRANERLGVEYMQAWEEKALAHKNGIEIGTKKGIDIGRSEGINIGRAEGLQETLRILRLLKDGMPDADILNQTGISEADLHALKEMAFATA